MIRLNKYRNCSGIGLGLISGDFSKSLSGLKSNTTYYVRAFVTVKVRGKTKYVYGDLHTIPISN